MPDLCLQLGDCGLVDLLGAVRDWAERMIYRLLIIGNS